jgi:hypothetical protein
MQKETVLYPHIIPSFVHEHFVKHISKIPASAKALWQVLL